MEEREGGRRDGWNGPLSVAPIRRPGPANSATCELWSAARTKRPGVPAGWSRPAWARSVRGLVPSGPGSRELERIPTLLARRWDRGEKSLVVKAPKICLKHQSVQCSILVKAPIIWSKA